MRLFRLMVLGLALTICAINRTATNVKAENTGAAFLKLGVGARQSGMGNAFTGIADDISAVYWNPAGLSNINKRQLGAMHSEWVDDIRYDFLGFVNPLGNGKSFGLSILYLYMGGIEGRNEDRSISGNYTAYDLAVTLSYSKKINPELNLGGNLKLIYETIENENAKGAALDLGLLYDTPVKALTLGLNIRNLGPGMRFVNEAFNLPLTVTCGAGYKLFGIMNLGLDVKNRVLEGKTDISLGLEISPVRALTFRAGFIRELLGAISGASLAPKNSIREVSGPGLGLGFNIFGCRVDYSFTPYENLGDTHRASFIYYFNR